MKVYLKKLNFHFIFFVLSIVLYTITHIIKIEDFPIYFFSDEAIQVIKGLQLLQNGFRDEYNHLFPLLMNRFDHFNLGVTVYMHMIGLILLGKKIWVVRLTTGIITLIGGIFLALLSKYIFKLKNYWSTLLYLNAIPIFFLHSRTGFETTIATAFFVIFLFFYYLYRTKNRAYIIAAAIFGFLSFYSYPGIWLTYIVFVPLLFVTNIRFHLEKKKFFLLFCFCLILTFLPLIFIFIEKPENLLREFKTYDSYLVSRQDIGYKTKVALTSVLNSYDPRRLFFYDQNSSNNIGQRHAVKNYGYFPSWSLPIVFIGLLYFLFSKKVLLKKIIIILIITAPLGSIVNGFTITRSMQIVLVVLIFFSLGIKGVEQIMAVYSKR